MFAHTQDDTLTH